MPWSIFYVVGESRIENTGLGGFYKVKQNKILAIIMLFLKNKPMDT